MTRNFTILLGSLATIVVAVPFANQNDWPGWIASAVVLVAVVAILWLRLAALYRTYREWRDGELE